MSRALRALCVTVLMMLGCVVTVAPASARFDGGTYATTAVKATNHVRTAHDRRALGDNACLQQRALRQAKRMARENELSHQNLGGAMKACGMAFAGENVAVGYLSGKAVVKGWMRSPGHRANILTPQYRLIGIGAVNRDGVWWVAQVFGTRA